MNTSRRATLANAAVIAAASLAPLAHTAAADDVLVLAHYMPWYETPEIRGFWGNHWTGFNDEADPNTLAPDGLPDIWSNYDPLIGLYDSADPDALECHLLQMKLAGIDGVIIDWYGTSGQFDYGIIQTASIAMFEAAQQFDMQFAVCFEDRTIENLVDSGFLAQSDIATHLAQQMNWLQNNWFTAPNYASKNGAPLLINFGPIYVQNGNTWDAALNALPQRPFFAALHNLWTLANADGAFMWVHPNAFNGAPSDAVIKQRLADIYDNPSPDTSIVIPSAFPGFDDVYPPGESFPDIAHQDGRTMRLTLEVALDGGWDTVQLVTWNDYGEGTIIEPTVQFGYTFLEIVQEEIAERRAPGSSAFNADDLRLPAQLYALRKSDAVPDATLDQISDLLKNGQTEQARATLAAAAGDTFVTQPTPTVVSPGETLTLTADVTAPTAPGFQFQWFKDGEPLQDDTRVTGSASTTLEIAFARADDTGVYALQSTIAGITSSSDTVLAAVRGPDDPFDVNGDGTVDLIDAFDLIDQIHTAGSHTDG